MVLRLTVVTMGKLTASESAELATNQAASAIAHMTPAATPSTINNQLHDLISIVWQNIFLPLGTTDAMLV